MTSAARARASASAAGAQPEPSTTAASYRAIPVSPASRAALPAAATYGLWGAGEDAAGVPGCAAGEGPVPAVMR